MNLDKVARELRAQRYKRTPAGILLPDLRSVLQGSAVARGRRHRNLVTDEGIALIAADAFPATLYMALWSNDVIPVAGWTGATFAATAGEITSTSDGYIEATRPLCPVDGVSASEFNMRETGSPVTCYGVALLLGDTRGGTGDDLFSALRFTSGAELLDDHDIFDVVYALEVVPAE